MKQKSVYPACAGIHRMDSTNWSTLSGLPRMRGDPPIFTLLLDIPQQSTPHARGSTFRLRIFYDRKTVYPACAGIHRSG